MADWSTQDHYTRICQKPNLGAIEAGISDGYPIVTFKNYSLNGDTSVALDANFLLTPPVMIMRLEEADAETLRHVRVQCLGEEYPATTAAFHCMNEVSRLRKEWHSDSDQNNNAHVDDKANAFQQVENRFRFNVPAPDEVSNMLAGFAVDLHAHESPNVRLQRFKHELNAQDGGWLNHTSEVFKGLLRDVEKKIGW